MNFFLTIIVTSAHHLDFLVIVISGQKKHTISLYYSLHRSSSFSLSDLASTESNTASATGLF
jgi:hypothetical protein